MAQNKKFRFGPVALTTVLTTDILKPTTSTGGTNAGSSAQYVIINHMRIANKTGTAATFTLYLGASAGNVAGTEIAVAKSVPANDYVDMYGPFLLKSTDVLVGGAGTTAALVITGQGEIGVEG